MDVNFVFVNYFKKMLDKGNLLDKGNPRFIP